jgi:hypothetical protein
MRKELEVRTPNADELREIVEKEPNISVPEQGKLILRLEQEKDPAKLYGELVKQNLGRGITLCCWWVCDGAAGGQCNCSCEMTQCGCGDVQTPGICQAGQQ